MLDRFFCQSSDTLTVSYILVVAVYCVRRKSMKYTFLFPQFSHFQERGRGEKRRRRQTNTSIRGKEGERPLYYPLVPTPLFTLDKSRLCSESQCQNVFLRVCEIFDHGRVWKLGKKRTQCNPVLFRLVAKSHKSCGKKQHYSNLIAAKSLERKKAKRIQKNGGINFSIVKRGYTSPTAKREKWGEGNRCFLLAFSSFPSSSRGNDKRRSVSKSEEERRGEKKAPPPPSPPPPSHTDYTWYHSQTGEDEEEGGREEEEEGPFLWGGLLLVFLSYTQSMEFDNLNHSKCSSVIFGGRQTCRIRETKKKQFSEMSRSHRECLLDLGSLLLFFTPSLGLNVSPQKVYKKREESVWVCGSESQSQSNPKKLWWIGSQEET